MKHMLNNYCQLITRRECELTLEKVNQAWQGGETKRFPFASGQGNENILSLEELLNHFVLVTRSCGVFRSMQACLMALLTKSNVTPFASSLRVYMIRQQLQDDNTKTQVHTFYY